MARSEKEILGDGAESFGKPRTVRTLLEATIQLARAGYLHSPGLDLKLGQGGATLRTYYQAGGKKLHLVVISDSHTVILRPVNVFDEEVGEEVARD